MVHVSRFSHCQSAQFDAVHRFRSAVRFRQAYDHNSPSGSELITECEFDVECKHFSLILRGVVS